MVEGQKKRGSILAYFVGIGIVAGAAYGVMTIWAEKDLQLSLARKALADTSERGPKVRVVTVTQGPKERLITLLGDTRAYQTATLYSKVGGYLKSMAVDRGDMVEEGQIIAEIDSAETDNQLNSALLDLENKRRNAKRARDLVASGSKSAQAIEQAETDFRMAEAKVAELGTMKSYEKIRAPFAGRVTARFADPGALIQNASTNQTSNQPLITIVDDRKLRVNVYVEQRDVPNVHVGDLVDVSDAANSTRKVQAKIARTSGQLDPRTRTLFTELEVDNANQFLVPGSFAYVTLHVPLVSLPEIPVAGLIVRGTNTFVAGVGDDSLVRMRPVKVATTDGIRATLSEGAKLGDKVAIDLPDEVSEGSRIQPVLSR
ncbi:MAG: efflux RND transporter periplasmic adaptor subunit [Rhodospirillales bacterium]